MIMRLLSRLLSVGGLVALAGCHYGFAGGGLPTNVRTVAVIPFENQTALPELQREFNDALRQGLESRLGVRDASEEKADAIVRGTILRYDPDAPVAFSADPSRQNAVRRRLLIVVDIEITDQASGKILWAKKGISAEGEYAERGEAQGRQQAIQRIVSDVVEGAQSQW